MPGRPSRNSPGTIRACRVTAPRPPETATSLTAAPVRTEARISERLAPGIVLAVTQVPVPASGGSALGQLSAARPGSSPPGSSLPGSAFPVRPVPVRAGLVRAGLGSGLPGPGGLLPCSGRLRYGGAEENPEMSVPAASIEHNIEARQSGGRPTRCAYPASRPRRPRRRGALQRLPRRQPVPVPRCRGLLLRRLRWRRPGWRRWPRWMPPG